MALRKAKEARPNKSITASEPRLQGSRGPLCTVLPPVSHVLDAGEAAAELVVGTSHESCSAKRPFLELEIATNVPIPNDVQQDVDWVTPRRRVGGLSGQPRI
jgi:hypothetical protein